MKRTLLIIAATWMMITSMSAQRLTDIQAEARFITDKMVVELGLSNVQRNNILNINLTYLDGIRSYRDIEARGWKYRNQQLKRMMSEKQWKRFKDSYYFYRPIGWDNNAYIHRIYAKYPRNNWSFDRRNHHNGYCCKKYYKKGKHDEDCKYYYKHHKRDEDCKYYKHHKKDKDCKYYYKHHKKDKDCKYYYKHHKHD